MHDALTARGPVPTVVTSLPAAVGHVGCVVGCGTCVSMDGHSPSVTRQLLCSVAFLSVKTVTKAGSVYEAGQQTNGISGQRDTESQRATEGYK